MRRIARLIATLKKEMKMTSRQKMVLDLLNEFKTFTNERIKILNTNKGIAKIYNTDQRIGAMTELTHQVEVIDAMMQAITTPEPLLKWEDGEDEPHAEA